VEALRTSDPPRLHSLTCVRAPATIGRVSEPESSADVTGLLHAWTGGDAAARDELMAIVYRELHQRAVARLRRERGGHTLQPTALVNEAYLRLIDQKRTAWQNRAHFLAVASEMMRRILVDHARRKKMAKRSGQWARLTLHEAVAADRPRAVDVIDLDRALQRLAEFDPRKAQIAELRFFGGLSLEETGLVVDASVATVERDWQAARAWLFAQLKGSPPSRTRGGGTGGNRDT
jgi:RNA polymerase sigma factor (TIGR02999 family)